MTIAGDNSGHSYNILFPFSPATPYRYITDEFQSLLESNGFRCVKAPVGIASFEEFRETLYNIEGALFLCLPWDSTRPDRMSATLHSQIGALVGYYDIQIPIVVIPFEGVDAHGLMRFTRHRCPVTLPLENKELGNRADLLDIAKQYTINAFSNALHSKEPETIQITSMLVDIVAFTDNIFRREQLQIADSAKKIIHEKLQTAEKNICYKAEGGDGGYFLFDLTYPTFKVAELAVQILESFDGQEEKYAPQIRISIDCGSVGRGISVRDWKRSTLIGPPLNFCSRIIQHCDTNGLVITDRTYQILEGENIQSAFGKKETVSGKRTEEFTIRRFRKP